MGVIDVRKLSANWCIRSARYWYCMEFQR